MKKCIIYFTLTLITIAVACAQEGFTAKAGLNTISVSINTGEFGSVSYSELNYQPIGCLNLALNDSFKVLQSIDYGEAINFNTLTIGVGYRFN